MTTKVQVEELPSPDRVAPYVSAHVRLFWPSNATEEQIRFALATATEAALAKVPERNRRGGR